MQDASHSARLAAAFAEAAWPARCALCAADDAGDGLGCLEHRFETGLRGRRCGRCAAAIGDALPDGELCPGCRARAPGFARVVALGEYRAAANAAWVMALKYGGRPELAAPLGVLLAARLALEEVGCGEAPVEACHGAGSRGEPRAAAGAGTRDGNGPAARRLLVPVPLHLARRIERGYDQAWLLARACAEESGIPARRLLRRTRPTPVQGALGTASRAANVRGAFAPSLRARCAARRVRGAEVWLVDDVLTSGSTAAECARALRRMGAARVSVLCVARP